MLIDVNLLLYAVDETSPHHAAASTWLLECFEGTQRVGLAWDTLGAFLRITTDARIFAEPLATDDAWGRVEAWLALDVVWTPLPGPRFADICRSLWADVQPRAKSVPDTLLAALAIEHGLVLNSADRGFRRFPGLRWEDPLAA